MVLESGIVISCMPTFFTVRMSIIVFFQNRTNNVSCSHRTMPEEGGCCTRLTIHADKYIRYRYC